MLPHGQKIICFLQGKRIDDHSLGLTTLLLLFLGYGHVHANQNIKSFSGSCSRIALHVWHSFTNSFLSCCELFFCQTFFLKIAHGVKLLFYALKEEWREVKLKKVAFIALVISLSQPCTKLLVKLFCQIIFPKQLSFIEKIAREVVFCFPKKQLQ